MPPLQNMSTVHSDVKHEALAQGRKMKELHARLTTHLFRVMAAILPLGVVALNNVKPADLLLWVVDSRALWESRPARRQKEEP